MYAGDTLPPIEATIIASDGNVKNLTGASVYFVMRDSDGGEVINRNATVTDTAEGTVRLDWQDGETDVPGYYRARFKIIFGEGSSDPETQHFPNDEQITVAIEDS